MCKLSWVQLCATPWSVAHQAPLSMGFSRQEHWSGLPWPHPGDLPEPGIQLTSPVSPALAGGFFTTSSTLLHDIEYCPLCYSVGPCCSSILCIIVCVCVNLKYPIYPPLHYSWASLVAQLVKNPPALRETWVPSLGGEDPLEKGTATHSSILPWRIPWTV